MEGNELYNSEEEPGNWSGNKASELCRVCACPNTYLIPIFEGEGLENELAMKIQKHLPIQVLELDGLPNHMCYQCASTLIAWHDLAMGCVEADNKLREWQREEQLQLQDNGEDKDDKSSEFYDTPSLESELPDIDTTKSKEPDLSTPEMQTKTLKKKIVITKVKERPSERSTIKMTIAKNPTAGPSGYTSKSQVVEELKTLEGSTQEFGVTKRCQQPPQTSFKAFQQAKSTVWNMYHHKDNNLPINISHVNSLWIKAEVDNSELVQNCNHCGENFVRRSDLATHLCNRHSKHVYHCDKCDEICNDKEQFLTHMSIHECHSGDDADVWSESYDAYSNVSENSIVRLESVSKTDPQSSQSRKQNRKSSGRYFLCCTCGRKFSKQYDLNRHTKCHTLLQEVQEDDTKTISTLTDLDKKPVLLEQVSCKEAKKKLSSCSFRCEECGRHFTLKDSFFRHLRIHSGERPFTCHVCGKQFRDSGGLVRHLKDVHAGIKNFSCDICGRSFASKATKEDHRRIHTGERPYICDSCGKTFKSKASLYIHSKIHTDSYPHPCTYCEKRFRRRQELLAHVTTHTGEKPHACDVCGKCFRVRGELLRHKLIHSEDKPYVCTSCGLSFRQKRYLKNHEKTRHGRRINMGTVLNATVPNLFPETTPLTIGPIPVTPILCTHNV